jgi:pyruvate,water dikinase
MEEGGLRQAGEDGLEVYVMAEIPSNVLEAEAFAELFDGFSIGSNDLTQLALGLDRDSERVAHLFDERRETVKALCALLIEKAHAKGRPVGICGQAPSDYPAPAPRLLVRRPFQNCPGEPGKRKAGDLLDSHQTGLTRC